MKKVFVSGCYDLLHSGHVEFFRQASQYGELYVGIGSDSTILEYKHHKTFYPEQERLFMVKSIRYVKDAFINAGSGIMDFVMAVGFAREGGEEIDLEQLGDSACAYLRAVAMQTVETVAQVEGVDTSELLERVSKEADAYRASRETSPDVVKDA